ncbi:hypothetical protein VIBNISO65_1770001 [Vibrio nigripulchritudo SO65]|uniref:hypothetical protein n=1 Tax=Vibrio nigripulchritudo TaxID=28173 RepID=UPI0003B21826|nr:hypothetical protein [Vibrio nigripulchritudo]CCN34684.1 hypothetical protein VIBNIAM115_1570001 [Vibrio nigripulchritudo AM115]CCN40474.1 hypothetical protein VIBNIFTn2_130001 [Vibrio nigripulchritudo FTn2]CCN77018.1 hypothetical protein VIBNISO65_1770001 [Vibrio nigripulchritudo SO65]
MYDTDPYYCVSQEFRDIILEEFIEPKSRDLSKHRISQLSLKGDKRLYNISLSTSDGFKANATFDLQQSQGGQVEFSQDLNFEVREIIISLDEMISISTAECGEDFITSQFNKEQFVSLLRFGFNLAFSKLQESNSEVILARSSWYGDEHPSSPDGFAFFIPRKKEEK